MGLLLLETVAGFGVDEAKPEKDDDDGKHGDIHRAHVLPVFEKQGATGLSSGEETRVSRNQDMHPIRIKVRDGRPGSEIKKP
jgi:hypothetical protein